MVLLRRLYNIFFGPWFHMRGEKAQLMGERMRNSALHIYAMDDYYQIQITLSAEQAEELRLWLGKTNGALNPTGRNKVITFRPRK